MSNQISRVGRQGAGGYDVVTGVVNVCRGLLHFFTPAGASQEELGGRAWYVLIVIHLCRRT
ncbi:hypothetical protein E2C01_019109 [Portunus trituberculatus]|uniref:Uncharacterized protein n=1 Tax=Portunus trituberculatus TaxID=210409 RepID=A0A5B7DYD1_PORTR|nr:hypothetical protein [Portunus trituberculatus]